MCVCVYYIGFELINRKDFLFLFQLKFVIKKMIHYSFSYGTKKKIIT